jgi:PncC family amidohydrolase
LAHKVIEALEQRGAMLATVESCTGGLIASRITDVSGSSAVFWGGWVTYDNTAKRDVGVPPELIDRHGAVSAEVATAMAEAGLKRLRDILPEGVTAVCVSTTGIAGPTGATATKPVGLCFTAVATDAGTRVREVRAPDGQDRTSNKRYFSDQALELVLEGLSQA